MAVAIVSGIFSLAVPFVTQLANRLFAEEPKATITIGDRDGSDNAILRAEMSAEVRDQLAAQALGNSGAPRVRISLTSDSP